MGEMIVRYEALQKNIKEARYFFERFASGNNEWAKVHIGLEYYARQDNYSKSIPGVAQDYIKQIVAEKIHDIISEALATMNANLASLAPGARDEYLELMTQAHELAKSTEVKHD